MLKEKLSAVGVTDPVQLATLAAQFERDAFARGLAASNLRVVRGSGAHANDIVAQHGEGANSTEISRMTLLRVNRQQYRGMISTPPGTHVPYQPSAAEDRRLGGKK